MMLYFAFAPRFSSIKKRKKKPFLGCYLGGSGCRRNGKEGFLGAFVRFLDAFGVHGFNSFDVSVRVVIWGCS